MNPPSLLLAVLVLGLGLLPAAVVRGFVAHVPLKLRPTTVTATTTMVPPSFDTKTTTRNSNIKRCHPRLLPIMTAVFNNGGNNDNDNDNDDNDSTTTSTSSPTKTQAEIEFDSLLQSGKLNEAIVLLRQQQQHNDDDDSTFPISIDRHRWQSIFTAIEVRTAEAEESNVHTRAVSSSSSSSMQGGVEYPLTSPARTEMTDMYNTLKDLTYLRLFGAASTTSTSTSTLTSSAETAVLPAAGSYVVTPVLLETATNLTMTSLTPQPTPTLLIAGSVLAALVGLTSVVTGIDFNVLVGLTVIVTLFDMLFANGTVLESFVRVWSPDITSKITNHEAGHFLVSYLLGNPVEGCVLSSWAALQDARFDKRNVSAGTSFFDPRLSNEINDSQRVSRSSLDRYTIIVMAGIAAEAMQFGRADGGAGDEMALVAFLSQLNAAADTTTTGPRKGGSNNQSKSNIIWNDTSIRNQARWGALQAVLLLREYQPCYDALVDALERGGTLGDCIYAIEKAGRDNDLRPLQEPVGYILDEGPYGVWTTDAPSAPPSGSTAVVEPVTATAVPVGTQPTTMTKEESLDKLQEYRAQVERRLQEIDDRLREIET